MAFTIGFLWVSANNLEMYPLDYQGGMVPLKIARVGSGIWDLANNSGTRSGGWEEGALVAHVAPCSHARRTCTIRVLVPWAH